MEGQEEIQMKGGVAVEELIERIRVLHTEVERECNEKLEILEECSQREGQCTRCSQGERCRIDMSKVVEITQLYNRLRKG